MRKFSSLTRLDCGLLERRGCDDSALANFDFQVLRLAQIVRRAELGRHILAMVLIAISVGFAGQVGAESFRPNKEELLRMPQLCQWMWGSDAGLDRRSIPASPGVDVSGCTRMHYFCDANTDLLRAEKSAFSNPGRSKEKFERAIRTLRGQVQHHNSVPGCSKYLRSEVNYTLGKALDRYARFSNNRRYFGEAVGPLLQSTELNPDDFRPYQVLGDVYVALNKRQQAEEAIYRGLEKNPESKPLLRRYKEVGGTRPLPMKSQVQPDEPLLSGVAKPEDASSEPLGATQSTGPAASGPTGVPHADSVADKAGPDVEAQPGNETATSPRHCRFCVDDDAIPSNASPAPNQASTPSPAVEKPPCRFCP